MGRLIIRALAVLTLAFLIGPLLVIIPMSFSDSALMIFPPRTYSVRWYEAFFNSSEWMSAFAKSLQVGVCVSLLATFLAYLAAVAVTQEDMRGYQKSALRALILIPLIVPVIVIAIAIFGTYSSLRLIGSIIGVIVAHSILALPITFIILEARLQSLGRTLPLASECCGASWLQTTRYVTLPLIAPALFASLVFGFFTSFDEVVVTNFISGTTAVTLPKLMFAYLRTELQPTIACAASLLVVLWIAGFAAVELWVARAAHKRRNSHA